jgi:hypothetical protein
MTPSLTAQTARKEHSVSPPDSRTNGIAAIEQSCERHQTVDLEKNGIARLPVRRTPTWSTTDDPDLKYNEDKDLVRDHALRILVCPYYIYIFSPPFKAANIQYLDIPLRSSLLHQSSQCHMVTLRPSTRLSQSPMSPHRLCKANHFSIFTDNICS